MSDQLYDFLHREYDTSRWAFHSRAPVSGNAGAGGELISCAGLKSFVNRLGTSHVVYLDGRKLLEPLIPVMFEQYHRYSRFGPTFLAN